MKSLRQMLLAVLTVTAAAIFLAGCQANAPESTSWEDAIVDGIEPTEPKEEEKKQKTESEALYDYFAMTFYGGSDRLYNAAPEDYWTYLAENGSFTFEQAKEYVDAYAAETVENLKDTLGYNFALKFRTGKVTDADEEVQSQIITAIASNSGLDAEKATKVVHVEFFLSYGGPVHEMYMYMLCYDGNWYPVLETVKNDTSLYSLAVEQDLQNLYNMAKEDS